MKLWCITSSNVRLLSRCAFFFLCVGHAPVGRSPGINCSCDVSTVTIPTVLPLPSSAFDFSHKPCDEKLPSDKVTLWRWWLRFTDSVNWQMIPQTSPVAHMLRHWFNSWLITFIVRCTITKEAQFHLSRLVWRTKTLQRNLDFGRVFLLPFEVDNIIFHSTNATQSQAHNVDLWRIISFNTDHGALFKLCLNSLI